MRVFEAVEERLPEGRTEVLMNGLSPRVCCIALVVVAALTRPAAPAHAEEEASVRAKLQAIYVRAGQADESRDINWLSSKMMDDYVSVDENGKETSRAASLESKKTGLEHLKDIKAWHDVKTVTLGDGYIEVTVANHLAATAIDVKGTPHRITADNTSKDYWVETDNGLMLKKSVTVDKGTTTVDGKPQP